MEKAVVSKEEIRLEYEKIALDKAKGRCKTLALATGTLGIFKTGITFGPTALALLKGSTLFLDIAVPNYFLVTTAGLVAISTFEKFFAARDKMRVEAIKTGKVGKLLKLESDEIDD